MFRGWWERQARRLALCSGHSPLELCPPLCRTNLGDVSLLGPSSTICSHGFIPGNWAHSSALWRWLHHLLSLPPSIFLETWPLLP